MLELELYCCFFSRFVVHQILLCSNAFFFFRGLSRTKSCSSACFFFSSGLSCTKSCPSAPNHATACFFSRLVVHQTASDRAPMHQIVLQCVLFFFFRGFVVHQIVLYGLNNVESPPCSCYYFIHALNMEKKCGKTKNWRFCIVFLFGAWARIWPEPGQPPKPRRILNAEY